MASPHITSADGVAPVSFDPEPIRKYDGLGPRYTSYPTADRFTGSGSRTDRGNAAAKRDDHASKEQMRMRKVEARFDCAPARLRTDPTVHRSDSPRLARRI
jgi:hypothetical protein